LSLKQCGLQGAEIVASLKTSWRKRWFRGSLATWLRPRSAQCRCRPSAGVRAGHLAAARKGMLLAFQAAGETSRAHGWRWYAGSHVLPRASRGPEADRHAGGTQWREQRRTQAARMPWPL